MNRRTLLAASLAATVLTCTGSNTAAQADGWGTRADAAIDRAIALDTGNNRVFYDAHLASAIAMRSDQGWHDPKALDYLHRVLAKRHPDGGYGLDFVSDAFNDGSSNPASTTYTVTLAGHVGPVLLEAHAAGVLHRYYVDTLLAKLALIPRIPVVGGYCYAYSDHPNDGKTGYCTHNVNAGVAEFLSMARDAGFTQASQWAIMEVTKYEVATYRQWDRSWRYVDFRPGLNPTDHNAYTVDAMMEVAPGLADAAVAWMMSRPLGAGSAEAHVRLARFDCAGSLQWLGEFDARMVEMAGSLERQAYMARLAAEASEMCE